MSEPDVASSDPTQLRTRIERDGGQFLVSGRKWFITGAAHPLCRVALVVGRRGGGGGDAADETSGDGGHGKHSIVLVPMDAPASWSSATSRCWTTRRWKVTARSCCATCTCRRPPAGRRGRRLRDAQARLGPGRVHHAMRSIGQCELALELMCERALERRAFGAASATSPTCRSGSRIRGWRSTGAPARAARSLAAGPRSVAAARIDAAAIKLVTAQLQSRVVDRAIQVFAPWDCHPTHRCRLWSWGRALRLLDAPTKCTCAAWRATNSSARRRALRPMRRTCGAGCQRPRTERRADRGAEPMTGTAHGGTGSGVHSLALEARFGYRSLQELAQTSFV